MGASEINRRSFGPVGWQLTRLRLTIASPFRSQQTATHGQGLMAHS
jgi:hypothetical protein